MEFDFKTLPYLCQKRFVELAETSVFQKFSSINFATKSLFKKRKVCSNLRYCPSDAKIRSRKNGIKITNCKALQKWEVLDVENKFTIAIERQEESEAPLIYQFDQFRMIPRTYKRLDICHFQFEKIHELTELISPNLVEFSFLPQYFTWEFSENWEKDLDNLFAALNKVDNVRFLLGFYPEETKEQYNACNGILEKWQSKRRNKPRNSFWHISWKWGKEPNRATVYRKSCGKQGNYIVTYNLDYHHDAMVFGSIVKYIHEEKET